MIKYLKYEIKNHFKPLLIISVFVLIVALFILNDYEFIKEKTVYVGEVNNQMMYNKYTVANTAPLAMITTFACILATIIPPFEFAFKMRKVSVDVFYALPIERYKLYLVKYLVGLMEILIPITLVTIFTGVTIIVHPNLYEMGYFVIYYLNVIWLSTVLYTINVFFFVRNNRVVDGIINQIFVIFALFAAGSLISSIFDCKYFAECFFTYSPLVIVNDWFNDFMCLESYVKSGYPNPYRYRPNGYIKEIVSIVSYTVIAIILFVVFILKSKKEKAEESMQISRSIFSYSFFIPFYIVTIGIYTFDVIILLPFLLIAAYLGYAIYRRTFKIKKLDWLMILISFAVATVLSTFM